MKKIAILTSGGDASGMNTCIYHLYNKLKLAGYEVYAVQDSFKGLVENKIFNLDEKAELIKWTKHIGGSILGCFRYEPFFQKEVRKKAINNLKQNGISKLIILGGNGSYNAAKKLSIEGIESYFIPTTIDNDLDTTEYTIGLSSAVSHISKIVDAISSTTITHQRIAIVEVMGRAKPDLTILSGITANADLVLSIKNKLSKEEIKTIILKKYNNSTTKDFLIIVSEMIYDNIESIRAYLESELKNKCKYNIVGLSQRSPVPDYIDRMYARLMSDECVNSLNKAPGQIIVKNNQVLYANYNSGKLTNKLIESCYDELHK